MAYIQERKTDDGKTHYRVQVRLKGEAPIELAAMLTLSVTATAAHKCFQVQIKSDNFFTLLMEC